MHLFRLFADSSGALAKKILWFGCEKGMGISYKGEEMNNTISPVRDGAAGIASLLFTLQRSHDRGHEWY
jgi:hypothetical protein